MVKVLSTLEMEMCTKVITSMGYLKETASTFGKEEPSIKDNSSRV